MTERRLTASLLQQSRDEIRELIDAKLNAEVLDLDRCHCPNPTGSGRWHLGSEACRLCGSLIQCAG
jgi:hypothetical protein